MPGRSTLFLVLVMAVSLGLAAQAQRPTPREMEESRIRPLVLFEEQTLRNDTFACASDEVSCSGHGWCSLDRSTCHCQWRYTTHRAREGTQCNYHQHSAAEMALWQLGLGLVGCADFLLGRVMIGAIRVALLGFATLWSCVVFNTSQEPEELAKRNRYPRAVLSGLALWSFVDVFRFGLAQLPDGNGVPLAP